MKVVNNIMSVEVGMIIQDWMSPRKREVFVDMCNCANRLALDGNAQLHLHFD